MGFLILILILFILMSLVLWVINWYFDLLTYRPQVAGTVTILFLSIVIAIAVTR